MSEEIEVSVTERDIASGDPKSHYGCPVAIAMTMDGEGAWSVFDSEKTVFDGEVLSEDGYFAYQHMSSRVVELPELVEDWIERFDAGESVEPIDFTAEIVGEVEPYE